VLDLTRVLAGPVATRDLARAGADVLRVDSPRLPEIGWQHLETGASKRSTTLDLAAAHDRRLFGELLATADVVVTGYRPGSLDQFGLDPESLMARRPGVVVAAVSAWGTVGPWAHRRGFDSIVQAVTGIAMRESPDGVEPGALPAQALDHSAGHFLAAGIVRGLTRQRAEGGSWYVGVALARLARALLETNATPPATAPEGGPTLQTGTTAAGRISCAAPPLTLARGPSEYPTLAGPWGTDAPDWR
jgi:crotonobetainyl-CoA:carnitine CoA-transferase CaiB-like acyl-CoA transferase